jgi:hypothetical protein
VYLGLGLRLGSGTFKGYDSDAAAYFDRAGVTDATAKQQINAFVVGVKALGLWNNMVCWPLRSAQNKGSGTTAYSLGGLGTYDGTLVSGPTWATDGIVVVATSQQITFGDDAILKRSTKLGLSLVFSTSTSSNFTSYGRLFGKTPGTNAEFHNYQFQEISGTRIVEFVCGNGTITTAIDLTTASNTSKNSVIASSLAGGATKAKLNANSISSTTNAFSQFSTSNDALKIMSQGSTTYEYSYASLFSTDLTDSQINTLYTLYKTTMGTGLGLP